MEHINMLDGNSAALRAHEIGHANPVVMDQETKAEYANTRAKEEKAAYDKIVNDPGLICDAAVDGSGLQDAADIMLEIPSFEGSMEEYQELMARIGTALTAGVNEESRFQACNR